MNFLLGFEGGHSLRATTWILAVFFWLTAATALGGPGTDLPKRSSPAHASAAVSSNTYPAPASLDRIEQDQQAALKIIREVAPQGLASVFGGSRLKPGEPEYELARRFGALWTSRHRNIPIASGGGPGAMEAANRGAREAGGNSIAFGQEGLKGEKPNAYPTHAHDFAYFPQREANLIDFARVNVIVSGGVGTTWEIFEILSKIQNRQAPAEGIILLGSDETWAPALRYLRQVLAPDLFARIKVAHTEQEAVALGEEQLARTHFPDHLPSAASLREEVRQLREQIEKNGDRYVAVSASPVQPTDDQETARGREIARLVGEQHDQLAGRLVPQRNSAISKSELYDHAAGAIFRPGGPETQWELFELYTKIATGKIPPIPIVLQGTREQWQPLMELLEHQVKRGVTKNVVLKLADRAERASQAVALVGEAPHSCRFPALAN